MDKDNFDEIKTMEKSRQNQSQLLKVKKIYIQATVNNNSSIAGGKKIEWFCFSLGFFR